MEEHQDEFETCSTGAGRRVRSHRSGRGCPRVTWIMARADHDQTNKGAARWAATPPTPYPDAASRSTMPSGADIPGADGFALQRSRYRADARVRGCSGLAHTAPESCPSYRRMALLQGSLGGKSELLRPGSNPWPAARWTKTSRLRVRSRPSARVPAGRDGWCTRVARLALRDADTGTRLLRIPTRRLDFQPNHRIQGGALSDENRVKVDSRSAARSSLALLARTLK